MPDSRQLVLATANPGKVKELQALLGPQVQLLLQTDLGIESVPETGDTLLANALLKARHAARCSGLPALADDSGLEVAALHGAPGVHSARYAGHSASDADNVAKLLHELAAVPAAARSARFRCVLVCITQDAAAAPLVAEGVWEGRIAMAPTGTGGFGYDPVFVDAATGLTAAELSPTLKNARSHRGKALKLLLPQLRAAGF